MRTSCRRRLGLSDVRVRVYASSSLGKLRRSVSCWTLWQAEGMGGVWDRPGPTASTFRGRMVDWCQTTMNSSLSNFGRSRTGGAEAAGWMMMMMLSIVISSRLKPASFQPLSFAGCAAHAGAVAVAGHPCNDPRCLRVVPTQGVLQPVRQGENEE